MHEPTLPMMPSEQRVTMEERVARLEAAGAATEVVHAYAAAVDNSDLAVLAELFADDATLRSSSGTRSGKALILAFYDQVFTIRAMRGRHFVTNVRTSVADAVTVECTSYFLYTTSTDGDSVLGWGTYQDRVVRHGARWQIAEKRVDVEFRGPIPAGWADALRER